MSGRAARDSRDAKVRSYFRRVRNGAYLRRWHRHIHRTFTARTDAPR